jgi:hypothetical protein
MNNTIEELRKTARTIQDNPQHNYALKVYAESLTKEIIWRKE